MRISILGALVASVFFQPLPPAKAQQSIDQAVKECRSPDDKIRLKGCTAVIESGGSKSAIALGEALDGRCWALHVQGKFEAAIADCKKAISLRPKYYYAYVNLGTAYLGAKDYPSALAAFNQATQLKSNAAWPFIKRAQTYTAIGKNDAALAEFRRALELEPTNYDAKAGIEGIESQNGRLKTIDVASAVEIQKSALPKATDGSAVRRHVALVIGNSAYLKFPRLENPTSDAEDTARMFRQQGFEVITGTNLSRSEMEEALISFGKKARSSDTAIVYYAGHGLQHQGINYLIPVDASLTDETDLRKLIKLQDVIADLQAASKIRILIVDACRDNDAVQQLASTLPKSRSSAFARGLAKTEADGTLVVFATQPNKVAADGAGRNSPFTAALLARIRQPSVDVRVLMARVRSDVVEATRGAQRPEVWDSLIGEFTFSGLN